MNEVQIIGYIKLPEGATQDELYEAFTEFLNSKDWAFRGELGTYLNKEY